MKQHALQHIVDSAYCFPVSKDEITIRLRTATGDVERVWVIYESKYKIAQSQEKLEMAKAFEGELFDYYSVTLKLKDTRLAYVFYIYDGQDYYYFSEDGATKDYDFEKSYYNFFQYPYINEADILGKVNWLSNASFYQIFIDRFNIGDKDKDMSYINMKWGDKPLPKSFAGGDLKGIIDKLDYIKGIGCDALYLTPIFKSPSNHKYDIVDYFQVDEQFGNSQDLHTLVKELHNRGMKIVLDAVFNHVSEHNEKFADVVQKGRESEYFDWFVIDGDLPTKEPLNYEVFAGCKYMPKWNTSNSAVQDYLMSIALFYINEFDIDGWRLDVSDEISHDFWRRFRKEVKAAKKDAVIIGENWHDASNYLRGDQYDSIMNYAFTKAALDYFAYNKMDAAHMARKLNDILARNTDTVNDMMMNLLDSHDTDRFYSEVGEDNDKLHAALALLYLFPGEPSIFYGTEVYTPGGYDPDCRRCMDWEAAGQDLEVKELIKKLSDVRKKCEFSSEGTRIYASEDGRLLCIERHGKKSDARLYINQTDKQGIDREIQVDPMGFKLFVNGGEMV
ncbi:glycoside hydrolase family 13 protein [Butyrivibrio proteoclasticus]|uniref:glycoside hydrolase family 13 protein n=1 Tax=Butyrivibrio proteoclasticus TaxID=43305 RepID=UPI00047BF6EA|nr:glycoside hydrolase family 13 protein [Butyrivibrio proteoclasticus]